MNVKHNNVCVCVSVSVCVCVRVYSHCTSHWAFFIVFTPDFSTSHSFIIPLALCTSQITNTVATHQPHRCTHTHMPVCVCVCV